MIKTYWYPLHSVDSEKNTYKEVMRILAFYPVSSTMFTHICIYNIFKSVKEIIFLVLISEN